MVCQAGEALTPQEAHICKQRHDMHAHAQQYQHTGCRHINAQAVTSSTA